MFTAEVFDSEPGLSTSHKPCGGSVCQHMLGEKSEHDSDDDMPPHLCMMCEYSKRCAKHFRVSHRVIRS